METPLINHITRDDYEHVYEPAEDTFLLLDALEKDLSYIKELKPTVCVEIGSGSGVNITALSKALKSISFCLAVDINPFACQITQKTGLANHATIDIINMDLLSNLQPNIVDILIFNPPYVPTPTNELTLEHSATTDFENVQSLNANLAKSWAGGYNGCHIIYILLRKLKYILTKNGIFYLLIEKRNQPKQLINKLIANGFQCVIFMERKIRGEHLFILKINNYKK